MTLLNSKFLTGGSDSCEFISSIRCKLLFSNNNKNDDDEKIDKLVIKCPDTLFIYKEKESSDIIGLEIINEAFESEISLYEIFSLDDMA